MKKIFIGITLFASLLFSNKVKIFYGWNLIGSSTNIDLNKTFSNYPEISLIWSFDNEIKDWQVFGNNNISRNLVSNSNYVKIDKTLENINIGLWVLNNGHLLEVKLIRIDNINSNSSIPLSFPTKYLDNKCSDDRINLKNKSVLKTSNLNQINATPKLYDDNCALLDNENDYAVQLSNTSDYNISLIFEHNVSEFANTAPSALKKVSLTYNKNIIGSIRFDGEHYKNIGQIIDITINENHFQTNWAELVALDGNEFILNTLDLSDFESFEKTKDTNISLSVQNNINTISFTVLSDIFTSLDIEKIQFLVNDGYHSYSPSYMSPEMYIHLNDSAIPDFRLRYQGDYEGETFYIQLGSEIYSGIFDSSAQYNSPQKMNLL